MSIKEEIILMLLMLFGMERIEREGNARSHKMTVIVILFYVVIVMLMLCGSIFS